MHKLFNFVRIIKFIEKFKLSRFISGFIVIMNNLVGLMDIKLRFIEHIIKIYNFYKLNKIPNCK